MQISNHNGEFEFDDSKELISTQDKSYSNSTVTVYQTPDNNIVVVHDSYVNVLSGSTINNAKQQKNSWFSLSKLSPAQRVIRKFIKCDVLVSYDEPAKKLINAICKAYDIDPPFLHIIS